MKRNHIISIFVGTALILLIPLAAMQFSDEVDWGIFDFIVIGILLLSAGFAYELATLKMRSTRSRLAVAAGVVLLVALMWAELAVGVFGTPFAGS